MRTLSRYKDFDRDAEMTSEALIVNVSPYTARFEIATTPGAPPRRYKIEPDRSVHIQAGYTKPFQGASPKKWVRPTIESLTEVQIRPGVTLPQVVHQDRADEMRAKWREALAKAEEPPAPFKVMLPREDGGEPVEMTVQPAAPAPMQVPTYDDDEDQMGGALDEEPPEHNDPIEPVTIPASETKPAKGSKGSR